MSVYAIIDTNVLISALLIKSRKTNHGIILDAVIDGEIVPIVCRDIIDEYADVLHRDKFPFSESEIYAALKRIVEKALWIEPCPFAPAMRDEKDRVFYEVLLAARQYYTRAYLVTGNKKHFPDESFVVDAAQMRKILSNEN